MRLEHQRNVCNYPRYTHHLERANNPASSIASAFPSKPQNLPFAICFFQPNLRIVISTEAAHGLIVSSAVEKSAFQLNRTQTLPILKPKMTITNTPPECPTHICIYEYRIKDSQMEHHNLFFTGLSIILCCHSGYSFAQIPLERTRITHQGSRTTIVAIGTRPLFQAVKALRDEYSWVVDYEDPVYSGSELVDDTSSDWRRLHPASKGVPRLVASSFVTSFDGSDAAAMQTSASEERVLRSVVRDYNAGARPERFEVRRSASGRLTIVGLPKAASTGQQAPQSIMDTPISLELKSRSAIEALSAIFAALSVQSGRKVGAFWLDSNLFIQTGTTLSGQNIPARDLLERVADSTGYCISFNSMYDADADLYGLDLSMITRASTDASGRQMRDTIIPQDSETCGRPFVARPSFSVRD
jgi:hypothetical protein